MCVCVCALRILLSFLVFKVLDAIELLHEKSESLDAFKAFKVVVELKIGKIIKCVKSGSGSEYYGRYTETGRNPSPFALFFQERGIKAQYTMSGTPQQNGVANSCNYTMMNMVKSMISHSFLPNFPWSCKEE